VHRVVRLGAPLAVAAAALLALPGSGTAAPTTAGDLPRLQAELERVTAHAASLADELEAAAARDSGLRVELDRLAEQQDAARAQVDVRARQAYLALQASRTEPMAELVGGLAAPDLRALADAELARRGAAAAVRSQSALADAVDEHSAAARRLQESAAARRAQLGDRVEQALAAQESARALLVQAERVVVEQRPRADADRQRAVVVQAQAVLAASRSRLDAASAVVTKALTPAQTRRSLAAATREAPVVALVEAAGAGYPQGYRPTGRLESGVASWYGPGFVGNPTASGAPYDPERLTCAHKTLPLGTVVRVTRGPLALSCLVNDRGPYVDGRIVDLSRAGSRALGFDGVAEVVVEVLSPVG
jgi:rare lipoprotein A (peptidoglycan hydrolase)